MKNFLATLAVLTAVIGTPVFAQSFDPEAGTGNVLPSHYESDGSLHAGIATPQSYKVAERHYALPAHGMAAASSRGIHRWWASRLR